MTRTEAMIDPRGLLGPRETPDPGDMLRPLRHGAAGGQRVIVAHGLEDSWAGWRALADRLDASWRIDALDLPWRAGNDYSWRGRDTPAGWLAAGLDGPAQPADLLIAHSFAATAALELLARGALRIDGPTVLICPLYRSHDSQVTWKMFDRARWSFEQHVRDGVRVRMGPRARAVDPGILESMTAFTLDRIGPSGLLTVFDRFIASVGIELDKIEGRVLVLAGGSDLTLSAADARLLADRIPGGTARIQDDFDHFCHVRRPQDVAAHISEYLRPPVLQRPACVEEGAL